MKAIITTFNDVDCPPQHVCELLIFTSLPFQHHQSQPSSKVFYFQADISPPFTFLLSPGVQWW